MIEAKDKGQRPEVRRKTAGNQAIYEKRHKITVIRRRRGVSPADVGML